MNNLRCQICLCAETHQVQIVNEHMSFQAMPTANIDILGCSEEYCILEVSQ